MVRWAKYMTILFLLAFQSSCTAPGTVRHDNALKDSVYYRLSHMEGPIGEKNLNEIVSMGDVVFPFLIQALRENDDSLAEAASGVLGEMRYKESVPHLIAFLKSTRKGRYAAAWALGEIGEPSSVPSLLFALEDRKEGVVKAATRALTKFGSTIVPQLVMALREGSSRKKEAILIVLEDIGDVSAENAVLAVLVSGAERTLRIRAARALAKCGTRQSVDALIDAMGEDDVEMKVAGAWSLGLLEAEQASPVLTALLEDPDEDVREWSARALENITGKRVYYKNAKGKMVLPYNLFR